jgi:hypothetical protein
MEPAQRIEILCDRTPAQRHVVRGVVAAIDDRLGDWRVVVHERHAGHCWDVRINSPQGTERHFVFVGDERSVEHVQETIERNLKEQRI